MIVNLLFGLLSHSVIFLFETVCLQFNCSASQHPEDWEANNDQNDDSNNENQDQIGLLTGVSVHFTFRVWLRGWERVAQQIVSVETQAKSTAEHTLPLCSQGLRLLLTK